MTLLSVQGLRRAGSSPRRPAPRAAAAALLLLALFALPASRAGAAPPRKSPAGDAQYNGLIRTAARLTSQGQHGPALETYRRLLLMYPGDLTGTRGYADALAALGRRDEADAFLRDYLKRVGFDPGIQRSLAELHRADEKFPEYLDDVVAILSHPDPRDPSPITWALHAMDELAAAPATADRVEPAIRKLMSTQPDRPELRLLLAAALVRGGQADQALTEVEAADRQSKAGGQIVAQFGEELHDSGHGDLAVTAYRKAAGMAGDDLARSRALTRVAEISLEQKHPGDAVEAYRAVAALNPASAASVEALLAAADIQHDDLGDCAAALETYQTLAAHPQIGNRIGRVYLDMADCRLRQGDLDQAATALEKLKGSTADQETQAEGAFLSAEILFFQGNFTAAQTAYQDLAENFTRTRKTNDAVGRYLQIARCQDEGSLDALKSYARMEQFTRTADTTAVLDAAHDLENNFAANDLAAEGLVREAEMIRHTRAADAALLCQRAADEHPKARVAPYALSLMGDICLNDLSDRKRALTVYERLVTDYTDNLLAAEARRIVERLRKNNES